MPRLAVLLVCALVLAFAAEAGAQTATPTATLTATPTATLTATPTPSLTPTPTRTPTPTATITPPPILPCGAGSGPGGAQANGVCGGTCLAGSVCRWDHSAANTGCICVIEDVDCDAENTALASMCSVGYCDRPPTMVGGNCTTRGKVCRCE